MWIVSHEMSRLIFNEKNKQKKKHENYNVVYYKFYLGL